MPFGNLALRALIMVSMLLVACTGSEAQPPPTAETAGTTPVAPSPAAGTESPVAAVTPSPTPGPTFGSEDRRAIDFEPVLGGRTFDQPVEFGVYPAGEGPAFYVVEQRGIVFLFRDGEESTLLDLRPQVMWNGTEEGLLSVVPDPVFAENRHLWVYYSVDVGQLGGERRTRLSRFTVDLAQSPFTIDPAAELVILEVAQPYANHNGGAIRFGPDGMLYLGLGDGGSAGDPMGNGQDVNTLLGSLIRIDVREASADDPYAIPADNPFADGEEGRPELWAWGLRNPWRMSFDPETGDLWLGDVGQDSSEEVNVIERGGNYGWNIMEGFECYAPPEGCDRTGLIEPVVAYTHREHQAVCSVTGGIVYRGSAIPALQGYYLYGDFCSGDLWALDGDSPEQPERIAQGLGNIVSFGVDAEGEVYILAFGQAVRKIVPQ